MSEPISAYLQKLTKILRWREILILSACLIAGATYGIIRLFGSS